MEATLPVKSLHHGSNEVKTERNSDLENIEELTNFLREEVSQMCEISPEKLSLSSFEF